MKNSFIFREAVLKDIPVIVRHRQRMFTDIGDDDPVVLDELCRNFTPWLEEHMKSGLYKTWFAVTDSGHIAAGAGLWLMDWPPSFMDPKNKYRGNILNVYTEDEYRRCGLAKKLTRMAVDWCHESNIPVIILHPSDQGRPIYESMGFIKSNEMKMIKQGPQ